jgi:hypothetical protein
VFSFQDGETALGPDFAKPHHGQVFRSSHALMPSEKCRIALCQFDGRASLECKSEVPYVIYSGKRTAVDTPQNAF